MDTFRVVVSDFGASLGKHSERLVIKTPGPPRVERDHDPNQLWLGFGIQMDLPFPGSRDAPRKKEREKTEIPFFRIAEIVVASQGVSISTDLIEECCARGIPVAFLTPSGKPYAALASPMLHATVAVRREQFEACRDARGAALAKRIVRGKLRNQANCLRYFGKYLKTARPDAFATVDAAADEIAGLDPAVEKLPETTVDAIRDGLFAIEGRGADRYWEAIGKVLEGKAAFDGREHRGTENPVNAALNYGYGILYARVWGAAACAGLEPFAGFLHVDRPGKPSLVLDLVEEFRPSVVDRPVVALFNQGRDVGMKDGLLADDARRLVSEQVQERMETAEPYEGERFRLASIIQAQARHVASFLRREGEYEPYVMRW